MRERRLMGAAYRGGEVEVGSSAAMEDLTARVRHPKRWVLRHPLRAAGRHRRVAVTLTVLGVLAMILATGADARQRS